MRRLGIVVSVLALVLGASSAAFATHSPAAQREVIGDYNSAKRSLFRFYGWNGDLVVFLHSFIASSVKRVLSPHSSPVQLYRWDGQLQQLRVQAMLAVA